MKIGKFLCGGSTEMQLMFLETSVEYKGLRSKKVCLVDASNPGSKLGTADGNEGKQREPGRTKRTKGSQKNRAALVLLKLLHPTWVLTLVRFFFFLLNPFHALV